MKFFTIFLLLFGYISSAQNEEKKIVYVDTEMNILSKDSFDIYLRFNLYQPLTITSDSLIIKKLGYTYEFGQLSETELLQTKYLLKKQFNLTDFQKNIVISYLDTIYGFEDYSKNVEARKQIDEWDLTTLKSYKKRRKSYDKQQKKCLKYAAEQNAIPIYAYSYSNNFTFKTKHHKKELISPALVNIFFKNKRKGYVILKPNGHFFYYSYLTQDYLTKFLNENWDTYIKDIEAAKSNPEFKNINFISQMRNVLRIKQTDFAMQRILNRKIAGKRTLDNVTKSPNQNSRRTYTIRSKPTCFSYNSY